MATSTVHCPHCQAPVTAEVGTAATCPACGGGVKIHAVGADEQNEMLKRLLSSVKIVERVDRPAEAPAEPKPSKRPWWKFWG